jgi:N-acetylmuramoyl-L-alanine amidase
MKAILFILTASLSLSCQNPDLELLARTVEAEAAGECFMGKYLVASTVVNRVSNADFPNCIPEVILQKSQYATPADSFSTDSMKAAKMALRHPYEGVLYFYNPEKATNKIFINCLNDCFVWGRHKFCKICS